MVRVAIEETEGVIPYRPIIFPLPYTVVRLACLLSLTLPLPHVGGVWLLFMPMTRHLVHSSVIPIVDTRVHAYLLTSTEWHDELMFDQGIAGDSTLLFYTVTYLDGQAGNSNCSSVAGLRCCCLLVHKGAGVAVWYIIGWTEQGIYCSHNLTTRSIVVFYIKGLSKVCNCQMAIGRMKLSPWTKGYRIHIKKEKDAPSELHHREEETRTTSLTKVDGRVNRQVYGRSK